MRKFLSLFSLLVSALLLGNLGLSRFASKLARPVFSLKLRVLMTMGEEPGVVGAGESGGGVAAALQGVDCFRSFLACTPRIFSSSSDEGQWPEFFRMWPVSAGVCARYSRLVSWARAPKDGARLAPAFLVPGKSFGGGTGANSSSCIKRCTRGFGRIPSLLLLKIDNEDEETDEIVRRRARGCEEKDETVFKVDELGVEGLVKEDALPEGGGEVQ